MVARMPPDSESSRPRSQQEMSMRARERNLQSSQMVSGASSLNNRNSMQQLAAAAHGLPHVDMGWNMQGGSSIPRFGEWSGFSSHAVSNQPGGSASLSSASSFLICLFKEALGQVAGTTRLPGAHLSNRPRASGAAVASLGQVGTSTVWIQAVLPCFQVTLCLASEFLGTCSVRWTIKQ